MIMSDLSTPGYQDDIQESVASDHIPTLGPGPGPYKFSQDEVKVLNECNKESFFKRSLPLGTALGLGTYYAIQQGRLKSNPRFGPFPKVTLAVVFGYFLGKLSYQQQCAEKLMALPGSYIGQLLRDRRDGKISGPAMQKKMPMFGANPNDIYSDAGPGSSLDLDTDRPLFSADDTERPADNASKPTGPLDNVNTPPPRVYTYEELRRKNRGQYQDTRQDPYKLDDAPPITRAPEPQLEPLPEPMPIPLPTNKYGDTME